jgi:predicted RNase H-like HicB family nuclease
MKDYHIKLFYSQEDNAYIADIPDLKTCSAHGETPQEALAEVLIAREAWLVVAQEEGRSIPEPKYRLAIYLVSVCTDAL